MDAAIVTASSTLVPHPAAGLEFLGIHKGSAFVDPPHMVRRSDGRVIELSLLLYLIAAAVDGSRDHEAIATHVSAAYGRTVSAGNVSFVLYHRLDQLGLVGLQTSARLPVAPPPLLSLGARTAFAPARVLRLAASVLRPLFRVPVIYLTAVGLVGFDSWLFLERGVGQSLETALMTPGVLLAVVALVFLNGAFHEVGHITACRYGGATPGRVGIGVFLIWPAFFSDVSDAYRLDRRGRIRTDLGGVYFNCIYILAMYLAFSLTGSDLFLVVVVIAHLQAAQQLLPFPGLDGHYLLSDIVGVADLSSWTRPVVRSITRREPLGAGRPLRPWARVLIVGWFALSALLIPTGLVLLAGQAPRFVATIQESIRIQLRLIVDAAEAGRYQLVVLGVIGLIIAAVPVLGLSILCARLVGRRRRPSMAPVTALSPSIASPDGTLPPLRLERPPATMLDPSVRAPRPAGAGLEPVPHPGSGPPTATTGPPVTAAAPTDPPTPSAAVPPPPGQPGATSWSQPVTTFDPTVITAGPAVTTPGPSVAPVARHPIPEPPPAAPLMPPTPVVAQPPAAAQPAPPTSQPAAAAVPVPTPGLAHQQQVVQHDQPAAATVPVHPPTPPVPAAAHAAGVILRAERDAAAIRAAAAGLMELLDAERAAAGIRAAATAEVMDALRAANARLLPS